MADPVFVYCLADARDFFLQNSEGSVRCIKGDETKICNTFPEAAEWYELPGAVLDETKPQPET